MRIFFNHNTKKFISLFCLETENHASVKLQKFLELQVKM